MARISHENNRNVKYTTTVTKFGEKLDISFEKYHNFYGENSHLYKLKFYVSHNFYCSQFHKIEDLVKFYDTMEKIKLY